MKRQNHKMDLLAFGNREMSMLDVAAEQASGCPLWVISGHGGLSDQCPLYSRKQTSPNATARAYGQIRGALDGGN
jgi:hypothetical protein